jgi:tetratricopeptide (TPR) repeat protein
MGERLFPLGPLPRADAVDLFVRRARARGAAIDPEGPERDLVHAIVRRVDGIPLAVELAAAHARTLSLPRLLKRMDRQTSLRVISGDRPARHATLQAVLDDTWAGLRLSARWALAQCSVFRGAFTLEAAEAVLQLGRAYPDEALEMLLDKGLLQRDESGGEPSFQLLESVRMHAEAKLTDPEALPGRSGPAALMAARDRHAARCARWGAPGLLPRVHRQGGDNLRRRLDAEVDDIAAACRHAAARGDNATAGALLEAAWESLRRRGPFARGVALAATLAPGVSPAAWHVGSDIARVTGQLDLALERIDRALAAARAAGLRRDEGMALTGRGALLYKTRRLQEALAPLEEARAIQEAAGDRAQLATTLNNLASVYRGLGRLDDARRAQERALTHLDALGEWRSACLVLTNLGRGYLDEGAFDESIRYFEAAMERQRGRGGRDLEASVLLAMGLARHIQGRLPEAEAALRRAVDGYRSVGGRWAEGRAQGTLGATLLAAGRLEEAAGALEAALSINREVGNRFSEAHVLIALGRLRRVRGQTGDARCAFAEALTLFEVLSSPSMAALARAERAAEDAAAGDPEAEAALAEALESIPDAPVERAPLVGDLALARARRGDTAGAAALLEAADAALRPLAAGPELGCLICRRGEVALRAGDLDGARAALDEASAIAARAGAGPAGPLGAAVAALRRAMAATGS